MVGIINTKNLMQAYFLESLAQELRKLMRYSEYNFLERRAVRWQSFAQIDCFIKSMPSKSFF